MWLILYLTFSVSYVIILPVMRDTIETKKVLTCDMCGTAGWPATEKELAKGYDDSNKVWEWGNQYDCGTICDECQETVNDSR